VGNDQKIRKSENERVRQENWSAILDRTALFGTGFMCFGWVVLGTTHALGQRIGDERVAQEFYMTTTIKHYPKEAAEAGVEGVVILEVAVDTLCRITSKRVVDDPDHGLHEAALALVDDHFEQQLIQSLKACSPGPVLIPFRFRRAR
jgi:hypothetical protein